MDDAAVAGAAIVVRVLNGPIPSALHSAFLSLNRLQSDTDVPDDDDDNKMTADATILPPTRTNAHHAIC